jgi:predicted SAM-dependent methyltransferase
MVFPASFPRGMRAALQQLRAEIDIYRRHRKSVGKARECFGRADLRLNIGCGPNQKPGWINIDLLSPHADLALDMREPMPFPDNSAAMIYSEHFFEHLDYPEPAKRFLRECHRVLRPGGTFSVGVPDTQWPLEAYVGPDDKNYFDWVKAIYRPEWCETRMESINYHFRQDGEHRFAYDFETLYRALCEAEFRISANDLLMSSWTLRIGGSAPFM